MIKRFVILRRRADMPRAEFWRYWEEVHGRLIAKLPGLRRYVQYHVRSERLDNAEPEIDGIAELWFESEADQKASYASPQYAVVVADEPNLFAMDSVHVHPVMVERMIEIVSGDAA